MRASPERTVKFFVLILSAGGALSLMTTACQSKFNESSPASVAPNAVTLEQRSLQHAETEKLLNQAQRQVKMVQGLVTQLRTAQAGASENSAYTPLDLFMETAEQLKKPLPTKVDNQWNAENSVNVTLNGLQPECRVISAKMQVENKVLQTADKNLEGSTEGIILIKTCKSDGKFVPAFELHRRKLAMDINMKQEGLAQLFRGLLPETIQLNSSCTLTQQETGKALKDLSCLGLIAPLNPQQVLVLDRMMFTNDSTTEFPLSTEARVMESGVEKIKLALRVNRSGKVESQVDMKTRSGQTPAPMQTPAPVQVLPSPTPNAPLATPTPIVTPSPSPSPVASATPAATPKPTPPPSIDPIATPGPGIEPVIEPSSMQVK